MNAVGTAATAGSMRDHERELHPDSIRDARIADLEARLAALEEFVTKNVRVDPVSAIVDELMAGRIR